MSRIKAGKLLSLSLAALLFSNSVVFASEPQNEPQDIIDVAQLMSEQAAYETAVVERGSFIQEIYTTATKYYPYTHNLRFEQGNAKFVEYVVQKGDTVKAGDVLARFRITASHAEFTRLKLDLQRTEEQTAEQIRSREQEIAGKRAELAKTSDPYEKALLELSLQKMEIELEQYKYRQQYSIAQKRSAYNDEYARSTTDVLVSPVDGVVRDLTYKTVDDAVSPDETLVNISSGESILLEVQNESGQLRYNMPVEIRIGGIKDSKAFTGRVVAADDAIPAPERTGYALIQLDTYDEEVTAAKSLSVTAQSVRLDNVLLIPRGAVTQETGQHVIKLTDGKLQKRYIETGIYNMNSVVVLAGVEEGETLILD